MLEMTAPRLALALLLAPPIAAQAGAPSVSLQVDPSQTVIDAVVPGGLPMLENAIVRINGSTNVLGLLLLYGPPLMTLEVDPGDPEHVTMTLGADYTHHDLSARIVVGGASAAAWHVAATPVAEASKSPLGMHVVREDTLNVPPCTGQPQVTPDLNAFLAEMDALRPGWVRVNAPSYRPCGETDPLSPGAPPGCKWIAIMEGLHARGIRVLATLYAGTATHAPWTEEGGPESKREGFEEVIGAYADHVDAWQLENELTLWSHWDESPIQLPTQEATFLARGQAYADLYAVFESVVDELDPTALRTPFGVQSTGEEDFAQYFWRPLKLVSPATQTWHIDLHAHKAFDEDFELATQAFGPFEDLLEGPSGPDVILISTECSTWAGDPLSASELPQSEADQARCAVLRQVGLQAQGLAFSCFGPVHDRPCQGASQMQQPHKFGLNGHYEALNDGGAPKDAAFTTGRTAMLARTAGWDVLELGPNDGAIPDLREVVARRELPGGATEEAGRIVALDLPLGPGTTAPLGYLVTYPAGVTGAVVLSLLADGPTSAADPGQLVADGATLQVDAAPLWIEWLRP